MPRLLTLILCALTALALAIPGPATATTTVAAHGDATVAAVEDFHPTTLLVRVRASDRDAVHDATGLTVANRIGGIGVDVVTVPSEQLEDALATYRAMPEVIYAERNRVVHRSATPNDPMVGDQYALKRIRAFGGWSKYGHLWRKTGGAHIAVVDSGIDLLHPEFPARKVTHCRSWLTATGIGTSGCQDSGFHGTHVSGIAGAAANNGRGIAGVAFDARLMALQAFNSSGTGFTSDIAAAMVYAARNGAKVANYSFGADQASHAERDAVRYAASRGVVQVAAAGNTGEPGVQYPARYRQVIAVSATNQKDELANYSTYGKQVEVAAPGTSVLSTMPGGVLYGRFDGTSMAAPHVAGLAALLRAEGYSASETRKRIRSGADDLGPSGRDAKYGFGRINVKRSL